jgi:hypothetical protein
MGRKALTLCKWLLRNSLDVVKELERTSSDIALLEHPRSSEKDTLRIQIPEGLKVYGVNGGYRSARDILFLLRGEEDFARAYVSLVTKKDAKKDPVPIFECGWFPGETSSIIFDRLLRGKRRTLLYGKKPIYYDHLLNKKP